MTGLRVAVLWTRLAGYLVAGLRALHEQHGAVLSVTAWQPSRQAPFDPAELALPGTVHLTTPDTPGPEVLAPLLDFAPDVVLVSSWNVAAYRWVLSRLPPGTVRVLCMDNQWRGTPRQRVGTLVSPVYLLRRYDVAFVAGERQAQFARRLGFPPERMWWGLYAADVAAFAAVRPDLPPRFGFVGRLSEEKGIAVLAEGYRRYRAATPDPWPLVVSGTGPLQHLLEGDPGVELRGFVQPSELPAVLADVGALVLPSLREPWGVVIHEAVAAGRPVICTDACGAASQFVLDGYSGIRVDTGSARSLAAGLARFAALTPEQRQAMGAAAHCEAVQLTPARWADTVVHGTERIRRGRATGRG